MSGLQPVPWEVSQAINDFRRSGRKLEIPEAAIIGDGVTAILRSKTLSIEAGGFFQLRSGLVVRVIDIDTIPVSPPSSNVVITPGPVIVPSPPPTAARLVVDETADRFSRQAAYLFPGELENPVRNLFLPILGLDQDDRLGSYLSELVLLPTRTGIDQGPDSVRVLTVTSAGLYQITFDLEASYWRAPDEESLIVFLAIGRDGAVRSYKQVTGTIIENSLVQLSLEITLNLAAGDQIISLFSVGPNSPFELLAATALTVIKIERSV